MPSDTVQFKQGDTVFHLRFPEWGPGVVSQAIAITHEGRPAQRLVVDFSNHGRATINTGVAPLSAQSANVSMNMNSTSSSVFSKSSPTVSSITGGSASRGWLDAIDALNRTEHELWRLGDAMIDPFLPVSKRLQATLESYRFGVDPRQAKLLLDWAVGQTGLKDPMTKYTRHELEQGFRRFVRDRDNHLFDLVRQIKRANRSDIFDELRKQPMDPLAKVMLDKAIRA